MGFHRSVSPSPPIKRSSIPTEVDENELNHNQFRGNDATTPKHKKPTKKNYMSSTISAASKTTPRKKILAERNETVSDPEETKNPVLGEPKSPRTTGDDDKPYDPLTNFLSPRPRFLRYNPNRRRGIVGDSETESVSSGSDSSSLSVIAVEIRSLSQADEEEYRLTSDVIPKEEEKEEAKETKEEEEEGTYEEEEEEEEGSSEGGLKTMFLLLVLGLSTMLVVSVNFSMPSWGSRFREGIEAGYYELGNGSVEAFLARRFESGNGFEGPNAVEERVSEDGLKKSFEDTAEWSDHELMKSSEDSNSGEIEIGGIEEEVFNQVVEDPKLQEEEEEEEEQEGLEAAEKPPECSESDSFVLLEPNHIEELIDNNIGETKTDETQTETNSGNLIETLKKTEPGSAAKVLFGVVSFAFIVACYFSLKSKPKEKKPLKKAKEEAQTFDQVYSFADSSFAPSNDKATEDEYSQSNAPSVEFLSEFAVGEVSSARRARAGCYGSEFSIDDSPLYRSFSAREDLGDGEVTPASRRSSRKSDNKASAMTPVRRSTRIRNLSIKSP